jgi:hypothetical protein
VFEAVNNLPLIFIHNPRRWLSLNNLVKGRVGAITIISGAYNNNVKLDEIDNTTS